MIEIINKKVLGEISYKLEFPFHGNFSNGGYSFPCDKHGNLLTSKMPNPIGMLEGYLTCLKNPEDYGKGVIIEYTNNYIVERWGKCICGSSFEMVNTYMGACQCPFCGRWYNLFGQEIKDPCEEDEQYV